jgi:hypothetical protein
MMQVTIDLFEAALDFQRQSLRRRNPHATDAEIEQLLDVWLARRPGAKDGDGVGRPASRFPQEP